MKKGSPLWNKIRKLLQTLHPQLTLLKQDMIHLIGYFRKFFPIFGDMIQLLNKLTKKKVPFKWSEQCQKA